MSTWQTGLRQALMWIVLLETGAVRGEELWGEHSGAWRGEGDTHQHLTREQRQGQQHATGGNKRNAKAPGCGRGVRGPPAGPLSARWGSMDREGPTRTRLVLTGSPGSCVGGYPFLRLVHTCWEVSGRKRGMRLAAQ